MDEDDEGNAQESRTELDSHANMPVVGRNAIILSETGRSCDVSAFTPDYKPMTVPIVDAAVQFECPHQGTIFILVIRNCLHVPTMTNNLIPPFIMRQAGVEINDRPKIHSNNPSVEDHSIYFPGSEFRITLTLDGVFSGFPSSKPSVDSLRDCDNIYMLTPSRWDPHDPVYRLNEESMMDWRGEMVEKKHRRQQVLLSDITANASMEELLIIGSVEASAIDANIERSHVISSETATVRPSYPTIPRGCDEVSSVLAGINPCLNDDVLYQRLEARATLGDFMMAVGSTTAMTSPYLDGDSDDEDIVVETVDDDDSVDLEQDKEPEEEFDEDAFMQDLFEQATVGALDFDDIMASAAHAKRSQGVDAEHLSKVWRITAEEAARTLGITTQDKVHTDNPKLARNYGTNDRMLRYTRIKEFFFMDTFFATKAAGKSTRGHKCCQLFVTDKGFTYVVPMRSKGDVLLAVKQFAKAIGAPEAIICDAAGENQSKELRQFCSEIGTTLRWIEEGTPWANKAELYIGIIKEAVRKDMKEACSPLVLWDYCIERRVRINNMVAKDRFNLHGLNAHTTLTGEEADISNLCKYAWYEWCYFREQKAKFPFNREVLGRVLGPATGAGNEMAQWVLKANGEVIPRRSLRPLQVAEIHSQEEKQLRRVYDACIAKKLGTSITPPKPTVVDELQETWEEWGDHDEEPREVPEIEDTVDANGRLLDQQPAYDRIINAEVQLQLGDDYHKAKVIGRAIGPDGIVAGEYDDNPMLNSIVYDVEFPDGTVREYSANLIAENMLTQVDSDGYSLTLMEAIVDYRKDESGAISKDDGFVITKRGKKQPRKTTAGWDLLVRWKDQSENWIPLKDMKESHPVDVAEFAKARGIHEEPAFVWWVPYTLRKRDVILSMVKSRVRKTTHKYGIEVPTSVEHAYRIDSENGNTFWRDAIKLEMTNIGIAFEVLEEGATAPPGWHKVSGHLVFDVKMDFTRKARWVLDGHKTANPVGISTYAGVVSRESVRIAFTYAALNGLDVFAADIRNAYLQAPSSQKDFVICGIEFGLENVGRIALIHRAVYGGKAAGRDFRNHLRSCMHHLDFISCPADPDVWMRPAKKADGSRYWEYLLLYTDDALCVSETPENTLRGDLGKYFELKESSIGPPKIYLGGGVRKVQLDNGVEAWAFSSSQYVQAAVKNVESYLEKQERWKLPTTAETPMVTSYRSELDVSPELGDVDAAYYMSLIGILRWMVELGRVDICLEVSIMSSHLALPREGHLMQLFNIFAHLKKYHNTELVYDPSVPEVDKSRFEQKDWTSSEFGHLQGKEELPPNMPEPRGLGFTMRAKVDADHASDTVSRRSRTGFLVYLNCSLIHWFSKKQTSVESSSFGSEFIAMKQCCEYLRGLRYKLRMMGIPVKGPAYIEGDNQSVLANTTIPDSILKKKSQSIAYHFVREGSARDEWRTTYVNTHNNEADLLTKLLPSGPKRKGFVRGLLHHIFRSDTV